MEKHTDCIRYFHNLKIKNQKERIRVLFTTSISLVIFHVNILCYLCYMLFFLVFQNSFELHSIVLLLKLKVELESNKRCPFNIYCMHALAHLNYSLHSSNMRNNVIDFQKNVRFGTLENHNLNRASKTVTLICSLWKYSIYFFFGLFKFLFTLDDNILAQSDSMSKSIFGTKIIYTLIQTIKKNISTLNVRMNSTYRIYNGFDEVLHANKNIKTFRAHNSIDAIRFVSR